MSCVAGIGAVGAVGGANASAGPVFHKQGAAWTYVIDAELTDAATGARIDMTGWVIQSQLRTQGGALVHTFECALSDGPLQIYTHRAPDTSAWPPGVCQFDVVYTAPTGERYTTQTVRVVVEPRVTVTAATSAHGGTE
jgi:hypothetical protein